MGNIFCGNEPEANKSSLATFTPINGNSNINGDRREEEEEFMRYHQDATPSTATSVEGNTTATTTPIPTDPLLKEEDPQYRRAYEMMVQETARAMVPIRRSNTRSEAGYYDQGFASALSRYLEQTTTFCSSVPIVVPTAAEDTATTIGSPEWEATLVEQERLMDETVEQYLEATIPKKERLFANLPPIVENLL